MASDFVWFELVTPDAKAAEAFYTAVVGWKTEASSGPAGPYTIFKAGDFHVGGMLEMKDVPAGWLGYLGVDDVDAFAKKVEAAGGAIRRPPEDIPNVGRFAVVADPQGAMFVLFRGETDDAPPRPAPMSPGSLGWSELHAADWEKLFDFYAPLFGWVKHDTVPMGEMGVYQTFGPQAAAIGGMFSNHAPAPAPYWLYYFGVEGVDSAIERVKANGGQVLMGPVEVPGGAWVVNAQDPQGGLFALLGMRG
ncbi:VOC family protein [Caulobacter segnis]|uniref:VOC family protein n=1 Tax=Caulobacter segnis TaxID=88688 RepID=UPI002857B3A9|nr:VOC family protein [Caulobacter segnis]MDR6624629.1 putative enzyme related to lactoylglutathione lyase [Caulobacter segnis]